MTAYEEMIQETDEGRAWYVVPAGQQMVHPRRSRLGSHETLASLDLAYPRVDEEKTPGTRAAKKKLASK